MTYSSNNMSNVFGTIVLLGYFMNTLAAIIDCENPPPMPDSDKCCRDGGIDEVTDRCTQKFNITSQTIPTVEEATCVAECVLIDSKYAVGENVNLDALQADIQGKFPQDSAYVAVMTQAYQKCIPIAQRKMNALRRSPQASAIKKIKCSPFAGIILGCSYTEYFQNCPVDRWTATPDCDLVKEYYSKCTIF